MIFRTLEIIQWRIFRFKKLPYILDPKMHQDLQFGVALTLNDVIFYTKTLKAKDSFD